MACSDWESPEKNPFPFDGPGDVPAAEPVGGVGGGTGGIAIDGACGDGGGGEAGTARGGAPGLLEAEAAPVDAWD